MLDPTLQRRFSDCKELINAWKLFHDYFKIGVRGQDITPEKEAEFLSNKSTIAMLHDSFIESLTHDQNVGQNIITIVARCITLKHLHRLGPAEIKKMEIEWHESYLLLNETVALLEEQKEAMDKINPTQYKMQKYKEKMKTNIKWFLTSIYLKIILGLGGLIFVIFGIPMLGIYDYKNLKTTPAKPLYYFGANVYRMFSSTFEFDELAQLEFKKDIVGAQFQVQNPPLDEEIVKNLRYVLPQFVDKIMTKQQYTGYYYLLNGNPIMWGEFLLPTTKDAIDAETMFKSWFDPLPTSQKNDNRNIAAQVIVGRKRNAIILMFFKAEVRGNAQSIKEQGYGIM